MATDHRVIFTQFDHSTNDVRTSTVSRRNSNIPVPGVGQSVKMVDATGTVIEGVVEDIEWRYGINYVVTAITLQDIGQKPKVYKDHPTGAGL